MPITWTHITARMQRLDQLARGLMREVVIIRECDDPLLFVERRGYLKAIGDSIARIETARVVLVSAALRAKALRDSACGAHTPPGESAESHYPEVCP
jgi:hypothetical protein